ncbi:L,D-transpeptidase [Luteolibacter arcticus]|uniref:L,D-transpeptidase n=1 Tax=Luteolibacter arcticus TaxID=1581411 RepID=A0ABT3GPF2_9BACT|nr:L,D-transpeptidase [Luteolibacter arcticus]MCW1925361.1 L,D-transpeptidase [Luteolibacter arcticus]
MKFPGFRSLSALLFAGAALALSSCTNTTPRGSANTSFKFDPPVKETTSTANIRVKMSTGAQRLYVVQGDQVLLATPICVGTASTPTPLGTFPIRAKKAERRRASSPGAGYPMTYWMEFYSPAYGMHWGFVKPYPATHGCVRLPLNSARKIFNLVKVGTPVDVARSQPWDQTIGKSLPVLDDSALPNPPMSYLLSPQVFRDAQQGKMWNF